MLPGIGHFQLLTTEPVFDPVDQMMSPPKPLFVFTPGAGFSGSFEKYISLREDIPASEAGRRYEDFTTRLHQMKEEEEITIPAVGRLFVDEDGVIGFMQVTEENPFLQPVKAVRVIHPEATHSILVGDKESDSAIMTEYFSEKNETAPRRWWIAAIIIFLLSVTAIVLHYYNNNSFGNSNKIEIRKEPQTWSEPQ